MAIVKVVTVYQAAIRSELAPGGDVNKFVKMANREVYAEAVATAPVRTGNLKDSHVNAGVLVHGLRAEARVNNVSPHAEWVHDGTTGPIGPTSHQFLKLPAGRNARGFIYLRSVRGQRANPWLRRAGEKVARRLGARL